jgi:hypothetical protein
MLVCKISRNLDVFLDKHYSIKQRDYLGIRKFSLNLASTLNCWNFSVPEMVKQQAQIK